MTERENGWYLRSDGYMTSECSYQRIEAMKGNRALDNHGILVFVKYMGGNETDSRVYVPHPGTCEWVLEHSGTLYDKWRCSKCGYLFVESRTDQGIKEDFEPNFCPSCGTRIRKVVER